MRTPGPPLNPSGEEGRHLLRAELLHGEYHRQHVVQRLLDWLWRSLQGGVGAASGASLLTTVVTMFVVGGLVVGLALLLTRVGRDRRRRAGSAVVLSDARTSAADLRRQAEAALAAGRYADAVTDAYRALATRQVERGRLADQPGTTAHEVALRLASSYPDHGARVGESADLFDATLYGDRLPTPADASGVLELDDMLGRAR